MGELATIAFSQGSPMPYNPTDDECEISISLKKLPHLKSVLETVHTEKEVDKRYEIAFEMAPPRLYKFVELYYTHTGSYLLGKYELADDDISLCSCDTCYGASSVEEEETGRIMIKDFDSFYNLICKLVSELCSRW